ncbi:MAG: 16S rRNA (cytosine(1402)-N(4))-methyltransferase RsmH [Candidatus Spechtbacterales bacterium]
MATEKERVHIPVLLSEVLENLSPAPGQFFVDCTAGEGGHSIPLAKLTAPNGKVLAIDADPDELEVLKQKIDDAGLASVITAVHGSYVDIARIVAESGLGAPNGILFDLGLSSWQLERSGRGFTFQKNEPLDMRFNSLDETRPTAAEIINNSSCEHLAWIFENYGEEKNAKKISQEIVAERKNGPINTTGNLVNIIFSISGIGRKINPSTKVFQALRIAVNGELENIEQGLESARKVSAPNARIAVISFHSLEDRLVKKTFKRWNNENLGILINKKVIKPSREESRDNPRSRSAKLRIFQVIKT